MDLIHELCPLQLLEVTKKVTSSRSDWPAYSIWLIYSLTVIENIENIDYETLTNVSDCQLHNI